jgi:hypothetical protein
LKKRPTKILLFSAAALVVAAAVFIVAGAGSHSAYRLVLQNADTGEIYASYPMEPGDVFSVEFIHSVNRSPVRDFYEIRPDGDIYVIQTNYYGFGAGVQTELNPGERLEYGDDGSMQVKNINIRIPALIYIVGTVSDHTLFISGTQVSLRELCGKNSKVAFVVSR